MREALESLYGVRWNEVQPDLDSAFRLLGGLTRLEAGLRDWRRDPGSSQPDADAATILSGNGAISGTVTESVTGLPLGSVEVSAVCLPTYSSYLARTAFDGVYTISGLGSGTCYVHTSSTSHLNELYDDIPLAGSTSYFTGTPVAVTDGVTTGGIDFDLDRYGVISGRVTDFETGEGVAGVQVGVYDWAGLLKGYAATGPNGEYRVDTLLPGISYAVTSSLDYGDELFDDIPCEGSCDERLGTPLVVQSGQVVPDIDFALRRAGSIAGRVVDEPTGLPPVVGYYSFGVYVYNSAGVLVASDEIDAGGDYEIRGLRQGTYFVRTGNSYGGYRNELYDDLVCHPSCQVLSGTPVAVEWGAETSGIDFALAKLGSIQGHVADAVNGLPLAAQIGVFNESGGYVGYGTPDPSGDYFTGALTDGAYYVVAYHDVYVDELYDDLACEGVCDPTTGDPVAVATGSPTSGIDFALTLGGWITGEVTAARDRAPLEGVTVEIYDDVGESVASTTTNRNGRFTVKDLAAGTYFAVAGPDPWATAPVWMPELYRELPCPDSCNVTVGTPIAVIAATGTSGVDFSLTRLGRITGRLTDEATGSALADGYVYAYDSAGSYVQSDWIDATGRYTISGLQAGTYYVRTYFTHSYVDELWDNLPCPASCSVTSGTPIPVELDGEASGVDFALTRLGRILGAVSDAATGLPLSSVQVALFDSAGIVVASDYTDATGRYELQVTSTQTSWFVATQYNTSYLDELFDDLPCDPTCNVTTGKPVPGGPGVQTAGIDFALQVLGSITGRVTDALGGQGLGGYNGSIRVFDSASTEVGWAYPDSLGEYHLSGLPAGQYFVATRGWTENRDELYDDLPCDPQCNVTAGTPVAVVLGQSTPNIDFALSRLGSITGRITDANTSLALDWVWVVAQCDATGANGWGYSDSSGQFSVEGLQPGLYRVWTYGTDGYVDELFNDIPCETGCSGRRGTPVRVDLASVSPGVDFALRPEGGIAGRIVDAQYGFGVLASVRIYDSAGTFVGQAEAEADGDYFVRGLPAGSYFAVTSNSLGYRDELYDNLPCEPACTVTAGRAIGVTVSATTTGVNFALIREGAIAGRVWDEVTGQGVGSGFVRVYNGLSQQVAAADPEADGSYFIHPMPVGTYYVRFEPFMGYIGELYDNIPCHPTCRILRGTPVVVNVGSPTTGIDFALTPSGD
ncbi:MAG: carboxypeptidase regulatory-like domain-containing protein [Acidobacteria bacterium]|nr:carboxypeptidase regulatory-like domain-containing protein [Acidobacteriota bacterium]